MDRDRFCAWCGDLMLDGDPIAVHYRGYWFCSLACYQYAKGKPRMRFDRYGKLRVFVGMVTGLTGLVMGLGGCTSIAPLGTLGPQAHPVWIIKHADFLSASRMLVITDQEGRVLGVTGGTVAGPGVVAVGAGSTLVGAGAVLYGAQALSHALQSATVTVRGTTTTGGTTGGVPGVPGAP